MQIQRLKRKTGNASNASAEVELRAALAWQLGEEGRGVQAIIGMVAMTRFDCMIGSSAGMRMAVAQALHHCAHRRAFGARLAEQPLMRNVLADLAIESEAALAMTMRVARALDAQDQEAEALLSRLCTPVGKYWICKRAAAHAAEAMECIGGSGYIEDSVMPRLYREAPVNAIWEGSGNIQCLDVLRAMRRSPAAVQAFFDELGRARGGHAGLDRHVGSLKDDVVRHAVAKLDPSQAGELECGARELVDRLATALQASLLVRVAPHWLSDAYCASRLQGLGHHQYGALPAGLDCARIIERASPDLAAA